MQQRPHIVDEELHRHDVGAVGETADEEDAAGVDLRAGSIGGAKAVQIDAIGQRNGAGGARGGDGAAVPFAHGDNAVHGGPRGGFELPPEAEFAARFPAVVEAEKLLAEIECDVVFHQDGDGGAPLADGLLERGAEGGGIELFHHFGAIGNGPVVAAGAADQYHLGTEVEHVGGRGSGGLGEGDQHQVELNGGAAHEIVHADGAAVGERERQVGAGYQDPRFAGGAPSRKDADAAIGERKEELLRVSHREPRSAAQGDAGGLVERAPAQEQAADGLRPQAAEDLAVAHGACHET